MKMIILTGVTAAVMLGLDALIIPLVMRPLFLTYLGPLMLDSLRLVPALLFYAIHIFGLVYLAGLPALRDGNSKTGAVNGAVLGFVAYSCYEMTSWTIMRDWNATLVIVDVGWGTLISSLSAFLGALAVLRASDALSDKH